MNFKAKLCPFCKKDNKCGVLNASSCWCMSTKIPEELKELIPKESKMKSCICKSCVEEFIKDSTSFKTKYHFLIKS
ncbi:MULTISPECIES: cysteine-rich CWC family protein [Arcobacteraceae]|uniref:Cysteine-rich CWC family protein n=1 Tax=Poseidonibacter parvus TaxID=1850254 RepID=A0A1P8KN84_9BACT|nr:MULTISPECIES: cysteine-rich CWC family protein [Arcobacteraceae]APW65993.1 hypothetical protein LPB137_09055 [Poseidonibacter parvus]